MKSFQELSLSKELSKSILEMGYTEPTAIQAQALPILLRDEPVDFLGLAATGTGKTAAFAIPMLNKIDPKGKYVQAIVLCPTRELALQVAGQINLLARYLNVKALPIYGGAPYPEQIRGLKSGAQIVVGTPGRVCDHIDRGTLHLDELQIVILDEADEMISMGFKDDLEKILGCAPEGQTQTWLFSATMSPGVRRVADQYLNHPEQVAINRTEMLPELLEQIYYRTHESDKPEILCKLIDAAEEFYGIIFCQTKALVVDLTTYLNSRGYPVDCLHGDKDQNARERTMKAFRDRKVNVLICTDVASRGLDVKDITHVINYSIPRELDSYVHRIGRTARSGKQGYAMSLVTPSHRGLISRIESMTKSKMKEGVLPTRKEIGAKKVAQVLTRFESQAGHDRAVEVMSEEWKKAIAGMSKDEIAGRFLALSYPDIFTGRDEVEETRARPVAGPRGDGKIIRAGERASRENRNYGSEKRHYGSEKRTFGNTGGEKRSFGGEKKTFGDKKSFGEKKTFESRAPMPSREERYEKAKPKKWGEARFGGEKSGKSGIFKGAVKQRKKPAVGAVVTKVAE